MRCGAISGRQRDVALYPSQRPFRLTTWDGAFLRMPHLGLEPGTSGSGIMCDDS